MSLIAAKGKRFFALLVARNREFWRDRMAMSWNILFPVLLVFGMAVTFTGNGPDLYKVAVLGTSPTSSGPADFFATKHIQFIPTDALAPTLEKLKRHQLDMLIDPQLQRYWINQQSGNGYMLERVLHGTAQRDFRRQAVSGKPIRYVDWVVPGVLAMNMMFSALFGVGYVIVRYRKNGVLKRLKATPVTAFEFLTAQIISRLWLILTITALVYIGTDLFIGFTMRGSYLTLLLVFCLGTLTLISMGLLVAARMRSEEASQGILNLMSWPMMLLSGVWFSLEGASPLVQKFSQLLPLTHMINATRAIMIDGAGLADITTELLILALMCALFLTISAISFRWE